MAARAVDLFFLGGVGLVRLNLALLFRDDRRTAHDLVSGTIVIDKRLRA